MLYWVTEHPYDILEVQISEVNIKDLLQSLSIHAWSFTEFDFAFLSYYHTEEITQL